MDIKFQGKYEQTLFYRAVILANQPDRSRRGMLNLMLVVVLGGAVALIVRFVEGGSFDDNWIYLVGWAFMATVVGRAYIPALLAARKMWNSPGTQRELKGRVTKRGVIYRLEKGQNEIRWERFNRMRKTKSMVTLVTREGLLLVFPRQFFANSTDWREFNRLVQIKILQLFEQRGTPNAPNQED
jgi:hypothetical protein